MAHFFVDKKHGPLASWASGVDYPCQTKSFEMHVHMKWSLCVFSCTDLASHVGCKALCTIWGTSCQGWTSLLPLEESWDGHKKNILINVVQPLGVICFFQYPSSWFPQGIGISMWTGRCKRHIYRMGFEFWGISENKTKIFLSTLRLQSHNDTTISNRERGKPNNEFIWCCSKESSL